MIGQFSVLFIACHIRPNGCFQFKSLVNSGFAAVFVFLSLLFMTGGSSFFTGRHGVYI